MHVHAEPTIIIAQGGAIKPELARAKRLDARSDSALGGHSNSVIVRFFQRGA